MYSKILLAVDGSDNAERAADEALKIASLVENSTVNLVYVIVPAKTAREILFEPSDEEKKRIEAEILDPLVAKFNAKNVKCNKVILNGEAAHSIISYEEKNDFDLLVIGSRGLNAVQKFMQGSVSSKVIQKVGCPVLMVK